MIDEFKEQGSGANQEQEGKVEEQKSQDALIFKNLFAKQVFYLGREVPREPLEFVIRCFGGRVGWEGEGSPFNEDDNVLFFLFLSLFI